MSSLADLAEHGPVLAIVDGRFLPVDEFSINMDHEVEQVSPSFSDTKIVTKRADSRVSISLTTRRPPHARREKVNWIRLYNRKDEAVFYDVKLQSRHRDADNGCYSLDATAPSFEIRSR